MAKPQTLEEATEMIERLEKNQRRIEARLDRVSATFLAESPVTNVTAIRELARRTAAGDRNAIREWNRARTGG